MSNENNTRIPDYNQKVRAEDPRYKPLSQKVESNHKYILVSLNNVITDYNNKLSNLEKELDSLKKELSSIKTLIS